MWPEWVISTSQATSTCYKVGEDCSYKIDKVDGASKVGGKTPHRIKKIYLSVPKYITVQLAYAHGQWVKRYSEHTSYWIL